MDVLLSWVSNVMALLSFELCWKWALSLISYTGIFGFLCADKITGSVPALNSIAIHYDGNPMIPFEGQFSYFN
jgi:hypothetical protein